MPSLPPFPLRPAVRGRLERLGQEFLADVLARETDRHPRNLAALAELGHVLTRLGRLEEGLAVDRRLAELVPEDPTVHYNLACSLALLEQGGAAVDALAQAIDLGYEDLDHLLQDEDLASLQGDERFLALVARLRSGPTEGPAAEEL